MTGQPAQPVVPDPLGPAALDFWIGSWNLSWPGGSGTNRISRILGGSVIEEDFECQDADGSLYGRSLSVRDSTDGSWRQTWVDSSGAYLDFVGVDVDGRIGFQRSAIVSGSPALQRMVWLDVSADGFRWEWQRSIDDGRSWSVIWPLDYQRASTGR
ncbi:MAG: hypothetical protein ABI140_13445 [Jatrophihabitantaceae bacterium]